MLQNKYREEFLELNASTQFEQAMYELRQHFNSEIPLFFNNLKTLLFHEYNKIDITKVYDLE